MVEKEPPWTVALDYLYDQTPWLEFEEDLERKSRAPSKLADHLQEELGMSGKDAHDAVTSLERYKMIESAPVYAADPVEDPQGVPKPSSEEEFEELEPATHLIELTERGFSIAHDRRTHQRNERLSETSARVSAYLVIGITLQALIMAIQRPGLLGVLISFIALAIILLVYYEVKKLPKGEKYNIS